MIKYTTLWEILMKEFDPSLYLIIAGGLGKIEGINTRLDSNQLAEPVNDDVRTNFLGRFRYWRDECLKLGLGMSAKVIDRIVTKLATGQMTNGELGELCNDLRVRLGDEMELRKFFSIEPDKQDFYQGSEFFGTDVEKAFPSAHFDIEESGRCLAFERWTASVSHLMKVLEIGLGTLAKDIGVSAEKENWQRIINDINKKIKEKDDKPDADWKEKKQFYYESALQFQYIKDAWRNHVMHARKIVYDEERATSIYQHVKEFMNTLAERLHEEGE